MICEKYSPFLSLALTMFPLIVCLHACSVLSDSGTPWTVARQAPLSLGFPRQEHWTGLPFPFPGDLPNPGNEPGSPALQADSLLSDHQEIPEHISTL